MAIARKCFIVLRILLITKSTTVSFGLHVNAHLKTALTDWTVYLSVIITKQLRGLWLKFSISGSPEFDQKCDISLLCNTCNEAFNHPWDLMVHAQTIHSMHIYEKDSSPEDCGDPDDIKSPAGWEVTPAS